MANKISPAALTRLQILYGQAASRSLDLENTREARLLWAGQTLERKVESFSALNVAEGKLLIDNLQASLGIPETVKSRRRPASTRDRQKMGTEGRRDQIHPETTMLVGDEPIFFLIQTELALLGWSDERYKAFLRSRTGPNKGRDTIHTLRDANRVHFALKRMASRKGAAA